VEKRLVVLLKFERLLRLSLHPVAFLALGYEALLALGQVLLLRLL
jgi:hypothetical protein